ncbi:MAG TPA: hypothetical protein VFD33_07280 [Bacillota bacterium]|nr:hypothetical protein [Bacillota bacterium]
MKRKIYNPGNRKKPGTFIPRRDLFPDENQTRPEKGPSHNLKRDEPISVTATREPINRRKSSKAATGSPSVIPLLFGGLQLFPLLSSDKASGMQVSIKSALYHVVENPKTIKMLEDICPYLGDKEQEAIYTVIGIQELLTTARDLMNHNYQTNKKNKALSAPMDPAEKSIEMIRVLRPYVPEVSRDTIEDVIYIYDTSNKLNKNLRRYNNKRKLSKGKKISTIETLTDIVDLVMPLLPRQIQNEASKLINMLKMAETMDHSSKIAKNTRGKLDRPDKGKKNTPSENSIQAEKIKNALEPMLDQEQKGSLDLIMKMANLLNADEDNKKTE